MPTRKITASPVKVTGKTPGDHQFESALEEDFFVLLRFNYLVDRFEAQPVSIEWINEEGEIGIYTPDALVFYRGDLPESKLRRPCLIEVKPTEDPADEDRPKKPEDIEKERIERKLKWKAAEYYSNGKNWDFDVYYEKDIRTPFLKNARFLLRYLEREHNTKYSEALLESLECQGPLTIYNWARSVSSHATQGSLAAIYPNCYVLIANMEVQADLEEKLSLDTIVRPLQNG